jgi:hypothetical protein
MGWIVDVQFPGRGEYYVELEAVSLVDRMMDLSPLYLRRAKVFVVRNAKTNRSIPFSSNMIPWTW